MSSGVQFNQFLRDKKMGAYDAAQDNLWAQELDIHHGPATVPFCAKAGYWIAPGGRLIKSDLDATRLAVKIAELMEQPKQQPKQEAA